MIALAASAGSARAAAGFGVRLAPATPGAVRFTFEVPPPVFAVRDSATGETRLAIPGFVDGGEAGAAALPTRVVVVAVPPLGEVRLRAVTSEPAAYDGVLLAPVPAADAGGTLHNLRDPAAYGATGSSQPPGARLLEVTWLRNQRIARIALEPAAYAPAARHLEIAGRVDVEVQVQPMGAIGQPFEPDDPLEEVYRSTLVNYDQGRSWRRPQMAALVQASRRMGLRVEPALVQATPLASLFHGHTWVRIAITQPGFYALNYSELRTLPAFADTAVAVEAVRMFTRPGYPLLSESAFCDTCELQEVPIGMVDRSPSDDPTFHGGPDGLFGFNEDYLYFFAQGSNGWANDFDATMPETLYLDHPYESKNYYYLTTTSTRDTALGLVLPGPVRRLTTQRDALAPGGGATVVTAVDDRAHFEQDLEYLPHSTSLGSTLFWEKWFWISMTSGDQFHSTFDLPGADTTQSARFRLRQWGLTDNYALHAPAPCPITTVDHELDVQLNPGLPRSLTVATQKWRSFMASRGGQCTVDTTGDFVLETGNSIALSLPRFTQPNCPDLVDRSALAWFDVFYKRRLVPDQDQLEFRSPLAAGTYQYDVGPFVGRIRPHLFDVTDPAAPFELGLAAATWDTLLDGCHLGFADAQAGQRRYRVLPDSVISIARLPATALVTAPSAPDTPDLRAPENRADYLVIYYDEFRAAAELLAAARRTRLPLRDGRGPFEALAIPISSIYDQFSGGRTDPSAIRFFLRAAFQNWQKKPAFVTLLGDASYDFRNLLGRATGNQPGSLLPTYENGFDASYNLDRQFPTDDWLLNVDDPRSFLPEFIGARIPVPTAQSALDVVQKKILAYETTAPLGEYRNRVLFIADDDMQGSQCDPLWWQHIIQTDSLNHHTPEHFQREYIYLNNYPSSPGFTKPLAREALQRNLNDGVAMFNFVGHGSPAELADEGVLLTSDVGSLANGARQPLFCAASCDVGKFDDPTVVSLGEKALLLTTGGAVGVISATEEAFSNQNADLNQRFYDLLFKRTDVIVQGDTLLGVGQYHLSIAAALLAAKVLTSGNQINNAKYELLCDAALRLNLPQMWSSLSVRDAGGAPLTQLARGQTVTLTGNVQDRPGGTVLPFDGVASVLVEDAAPTLQTGFNADPLCTSHYYSIGFEYAAGTVYHGDVTGSAGQYQGRFVVPMDAAIGPLGRVRVYFQGRSGAADLDGAGELTLPVVAGTPDPGDTRGPRVSLSFVGGSTSVRPDATLRIDLFDDSGIMTTGHSLQNAIVVTVDDNTTSRKDVTSSFRYAADSYQSGTASYTLQHLAPGHHRIAVTAADNLATGLFAADHRSSGAIEFDVTSTPSLHIEQAYLFPNPTRSSGPGAGGSFVIDAPGDSLNALIRIYTVSGRLVRTLTQFGALAQSQIPWNGRDEQGDALANGAYLFRVFVYNRLADGASSAKERAAGSGRFVIVNR